MGTKISVVVPTFRRPELLNKCIEALENQELPKESFEIIVVSDGPDESTRNLFNRRVNEDLQIRYFQLPEKKGPAAARNLGWQMASGKLIAFTDDDCLPDRLWLKTINGEYNNEPEIAYSGRVIVPINGKPTDFERNTKGLETAEFVTANCACTKQALEKVNGFDEAFSMAWREDSDLEFSFLRNNIPVLRLIDAIVIHPVRQAPWGVSIKEQKKGMFNALLYKKFPDLYRQKIQPQPPWNYYMMIVFFLITIASLGFKAWWIAGAAFSGWLILLVMFIYKRLSSTSHSYRHVTEMIVTSLFIPFLSVFWQLYGSFKYRVYFI